MLVTRTIDLPAVASAGYPTYSIRPAGGSWTAPTNSGVAQYGSSKTYLVDLDLDPGHYAIAWISGAGADPKSQSFAVSSPQAGDAYARIGADGAGLTAVALTDDYATKADLLDADEVEGLIGGPADAAAIVTAINAAGVRLRADGLDSVVVEAGVNARQAMAIILAASSGVMVAIDNNNGTFGVTIRAPGSGATRITATTNANGTRSATSLSPPA